MLPEMWPLARDLLAGSIVVSLEQIAAAIRLIAEGSRTGAEGAGAGCRPRVKRSWYDATMPPRPEARP